jgi:hypothetical protein
MDMPVNPLSPEPPGGVDPANFMALKDAARYFPRPNGKRISLQTLYRWTSQGVRGSRLKTIRLGQQVCTCEVWLRQFIADLNGGGAVISNSVPSSDHERSHRRQVDESLDRQGL